MWTLLILLALAAIGHTIFWVALVNRIHALGIKQKWVDIFTVIGVLLWGILPVAIGAVLAKWISVAPAVTVITWSYIAAAAVVSIGAAIQRWLWHTSTGRPGTLLSNHTVLTDMAKDTAEPLTSPGMATWLRRIPGNQVLKYQVQSKQLAIPRLGAAHAGLRMAHITDLHMSGRVRRPFFERIIDEVNNSEPDLIAVTGDLVEWNSCLDWIPATFGRLRAPNGVYYVLGNHDRRVDQARLRKGLDDAGLIYLGGTWRELTVGQTRLVLAGNELPWYAPAADLSTCPKQDADGLPLRVLLAHSPDQFRWAQANDVDLVLAGHLHGGQVRFPLLGPITSPSRHGVRYTAGTFRSGNTVMHVSRGISSLTPIRLNCPPEIAVLTLCPGATG